MAKSKISAKDFLDFLDDEEESNPVAFSPKAQQKPNANPTDAQQKPNNPKVKAQQKANGSPTRKTPKNPQAQQKPNALPTQGQQKPNKNKLFKTNPDDLSRQEAEIMAYLIEVRKSGYFGQHPILNAGEIAEYLKRPYPSTSELLRRLELYEFISSERLGRGRGGKKKISFNQEKWDTLEIWYERYRNQKSPTEPQQKPNASPIKAQQNALSSSSILINTTTTTEPADFEISQEDLDVMRSLGMGKGHLSQFQSMINSGPLSKQDIENSIRDYAFDVRAGKQVQGLNLLFSELRKDRPYHSADRAQAIKIELARIRVSAEETRKLEEELQRARETLAYNAWLKDLSPEDREEILRKYPFNLTAEQVLRAEFHRQRGS